MVDKSNVPVADARLLVDNTSFTVDTDTTGTYHRYLPPGQYSLTASATGYFPTTVAVTVLTNGSLPAVIVLEKDMRVWGMSRLSFVFSMGQTIY